MLEATAKSEVRGLEAVEVETESWEKGVVVPTPMADVVADCPPKVCVHASYALPPEPQATPVEESNPRAEKVAQPAEATEESTRLVEVAVPEMVRPPTLVPSPMVEEASARKPPVPLIVKTLLDATLKSANMPLKPEAVSAAKSVPLVDVASESCAYGELVPMPKSDVVAL